MRRPLALAITALLSVGCATPSSNAPPVDMDAATDAAPGDASGVSDDAPATDAPATDASRPDVAPPADAATAGLVPQRVNVAATSVSAIEADDERIYWISLRTGSSGGSVSVHAAPLAGGAPQMLAALPLASMFAGASFIVADATDLYVSVQGILSGIYRIPKAGGAPVEFVPGARSVAGLRVDDTWLFFTNGAEVRRVRKSDGMSELIASSGNPYALETDASFVYWLANSLLYRAPKASGGAGVVRAPRDVVGHRSDGTTLWTFASTRTGGELFSSPLDPPTAAVSRVGGLPGGGRGVVALDRDAVWLAAGSSLRSSLIRVPAGAGAPVTVAADQGTPFSFVLTPSYVVWLTTASDRTSVFYRVRR